MKRVMDSLAKLKLGECWLWSPAWLEVLRRIKIRERKSFDSSATPEVGVRVEQPTARPAVDLDALKVAMAETVERAKANDPAELRRRIAELEDELRGAYDSLPQPVETTVYVPDRDAVAKLSQTVAEMEVLVANFDEHVGEVDATVASLREVKGEAVGYRDGRKVGGTFANVLVQLRAEGMIDYPAQGYVALTTEGRGVAMVPPIERTTRGLQAAVMERLADPERRVLRAVIDAYPHDISKQDVGAAAGYSVGEKVGGTFGNILGRLRSLGLIDYPRQGYVRAESVLFLD
jgi:hypothetical protein